MSLQSRIERAFASGVVPNASELFDGDDEGAYKYFCERPWKELSPDILDYHSTALATFSSTAFAYYLPAFMIASIQNEDLGVSDAVIRSLTPPKDNPSRPSYAARWSQLTQLQKIVAIEFLGHFRSRNPIAISTTMNALEATISD